MPLLLRTVLPHRPTTLLGVQPRQHPQQHPETRRPKPPPLPDTFEGISLAEAIERYGPPVDDGAAT